MDPVKQAFRELCSSCAKRHECDKTCAPMESMANGNKLLKERLLDIDYDHYDNQDYKEVLADAQKCVKKTMEDIQAITNIQRRAVAVLLFAGFTIQEIADLFKVTRQWIHRLSKQ